MNRGIAAPVAREHVLQNEFLLADVTLGVDEILLGRRYLSLGACGFDGGKSSLIDLVSVVFEEALRGGEGFLLHAHVSVEAHEVVIEANDAGDGADDLLLKDVVGNLLAVLRDMNEAAVEVGSKATQQRLRYGDAQGGKRIRFDDKREGVLILVLVGKGGGDLGSGAEALKITDVSDERVRCLIGGAGDLEVRLRNVGTLAQYLSR